MSSNTIIPGGVTPLNRQARQAQDFIAAKQRLDALERQHSALEATLSERIRQLEPVCAEALQEFGTEDLSVIREQVSRSMDEDDAALRRLKADLDAFAEKFAQCEAQARQVG